MNHFRTCLPPFKNLGRLYGISMRQNIACLSLLLMLSAVAACGGDDSPDSDSNADTDVAQDSGPALDAGSDTADTSSDTADTSSDTADTSSDTADTPDAELDADPDATSFPDDISFESFMEAIVSFNISSVCTRAWECSTPFRDGAPPLGRRFDSVQECRSTLQNSALFQATVSESLEPRQSLIEAGRINYDSQQAAECLEELTSLSVAQICGPNFLAFAQACQPFPTRGTIAPGGTCINASECEGEEGYCSRPPDTCNGTCKLFDGCGMGPACPDDEGCVFHDATTASCEPLKSRGTPCDRQSECGERLYCTSGVSSTCELRKSSGMDCARQEQCADRYACVYGTGGIDRTCEDPRSQGEACRNQDECGDDLDCMILDSESTGICTGRGDLQRGDSCSHTEYCAPSDTCVDETCIKLEYLSQGSTCTDETHCAPGTICQLATPGATTGTCKLPGQIDDTCVDTTSCAFELYCEGASDSQAGSCAPSKADGAGCSENNDCTSGRCREDVCGTPPQMCPIP
jgi:predicted small lipoprotein YifL